MNARYCLLKSLSSEILRIKSECTSACSWLAVIALNKWSSCHGCSPIESSASMTDVGYHVLHTEGHLVSSKSSARRCISSWSLTPSCAFNRDKISLTPECTVNKSRMTCNSNSVVKRISLEGGNCGNSTSKRGG